MLKVGWLRIKVSIKSFSVVIFSDTLHVINVRLYSLLVLLIMLVHIQGR